MKLNIFTEGGKGIGYGHITRCSALYDEAVKRGVETALYVHGNIEGTRILGSRSIYRVDWLTKSFLSENIQEQDCCIVDSYIATGDLLQVISDISRRVLYIDDNARIRYPKGIVVNPSLSPYHLEYPRDDGNIYLLGRDYVIVRTPFAEGGTRTASDRVSKVLITMGGAGYEVTRKVIQTICAEYPCVRFVAVVEDASKENLWAIGRGIENVEYYSDLDAQTMKMLMIQSDFAITAAGQSVYELLATRTPFIPVKTAGNQENNIRGLRAINRSTVFLNDGFRDKLRVEVESMFSLERRQDIWSEDDYVDGRGSARIMDCLLP